ncbi:hypothetical protein N7455_001034 [Penicillium solitum]|uniref:uncharacterized protein n=1 Tax=Penicillium solitum TaxID=60172 RepID=UPI0032C42086|nr:hypothetical protein N7536_006486 [Penicillium majusculum]KAJ5877569.1 hypothetical protein N7455_001034 [Penicillium solitum]
MVDTKPILILEDETNPILNPEKQERLFDHSRAAFTRMASWRNITLRQWIAAAVPLLVAISLLLGSYRLTPSQFPLSDFRVSGLRLDPSSLESQIPLKMLHQQPA